MKAIRILFGNIKESFKGVFRNGSLSLASISCISITLILLGFSMLLSFNIKSFTTQIEKDMSIIVFLKREITEDQTNEISKKLKSLSTVDYSKTKFNSKEDIKKSMQAESEVLKSAFAEYTEETNPLKDTFIVKVKNIERIGQTAKTIKQFNMVDTVKYGEGSVEELVKIFDIVEKIAFASVVALAFVTWFLIGNTIKVTIQSRRREIEIRRLVGASNMFITQPFLFEGIILGFLGSIIPIGVCCDGYYYLYE